MGEPAVTVTEGAFAINRVVELHRSDHHRSWRVDCEDAHPETGAPWTDREKVGVDVYHRGDGKPTRIVFPIPGGWVGRVWAIVEPYKDTIVVVLLRREPLRRDAPRAVVWEKTLRREPDGGSRG